MMGDVRQVAAALGGEVAGRDAVLAPGPGHSASDRSLSVRLDPKAPDGFLVTSFCGDDWRECRDHVRERLGLARAEGRTVVVTPSRPTRREHDDRSTIARRLWAEGVDPTGTPVEIYLARRRLLLPPGAAGCAIRWHPTCPFGREYRNGAMLALVRDVVTNEPTGIHRTALAPDGTKRADLGSGGRMMLGPAAGGVVKLSADVDVTTMLGIGEGIESTLSLRFLPEFGASPVWAALSAGQLAAFPLLAGVESLWIAVDHDEAGIRAAEAVAERWRDREVFRACSRRDGEDLNDVAMRAA